MTNDNAGETLQLLLKRAEREQRQAEEIYRKQPDINPITAIVMAMDYATAEEVDIRFRSGEYDLSHAMTWLGSFARMEYVLRWAEEGLIKIEEVYEQLPSLWSGSDPDDTDPRFLLLWREAHLANRRKMILGERAFPEGKHKRRLIPVYRGQPVEAKWGIAWTLNMDVANKFAKGAGSRAPSEGDVWRGIVAKTNILAYIADRGEDEVIIDPANIYDKQVVARWRFQNTKTERNENEKEDKQ